MMKTVALIALFTGIAASVAAIVIQVRKIIRTGNADGKTVRTLVFVILFALLAAVNVYLTFKFF